MNRLLAPQSDREPIPRFFCSYPPTIPQDAPDLQTKKAAVVQFEFPPVWTGVDLGHGKAFGREYGIFF
jgi:hypothetical protein